MELISHVYLKYFLNLKNVNMYINLLFELRKLDVGWTGTAVKAVVPM